MFPSIFVWRHETFDVCQAIYHDSLKLMEPFCGAQQLEHMTGNATCTMLLEAKFDSRPLVYM